MPVIVLAHSSHPKLVAVTMIYTMLKQLDEKAFLLIFNRANINA